MEPRPGDFDNWPMALRQLCHRAECAIVESRAACASTAATLALLDMCRPDTPKPKLGHSARN
jgi:hypothetical protein